jgi:hypothetical protein
MWVIWSVGIFTYLVIALIFAMSIKEVKGFDKLIFLLWPIQITTFLMFAIGAIIYGLFIEFRRRVKR